MLRTCFKWPMFFIGAMVAVFFFPLPSPESHTNYPGHPSQRHRKDMIPSDDPKDLVVGIEDGELPLRAGAP